MLSGIVIAVVGLPALLTFVWFSEVLFGCFALKRGTPQIRSPGVLSHRTAVLIPAHNEGAGILPTIWDVQAQLGPNDFILVVADNCTDDTAAIVHAAGVEVTVRSDPARRGKGYALEFGVRHLQLNPSDIVVIMDADCRLGENALRLLSTNARASGRPVQSLYLMLPSDDLSSEERVSLFAWRVRNWVRPLGLKFFKMPTPLFGTGMAFPFGLLSERDLGNARLAEDCALGIALASAGFAPLFIDEAIVHSHFPMSKDGSKSQRQRWEKGHLENIIDLVPQGLTKSLRDRNLALAALAIDMAVPPFSLLVLVSALCVFLGGTAVLLGASVTALVIPLISSALVVSGTALAWSAVGREILSLSQLLRLPLHVVSKLSFYFGIASGKASSQWIRTDRK